MLSVVLDWRAKLSDSFAITEMILQQTYKGAKAKSIVSCDKGFVTNILLAQTANRTSLESAQSERKSIHLFCR